MVRLDEIIRNVLQQSGISIDPEGGRTVIIKTPSEASRLFKHASEAGLKIQISGSGSRSVLSDDRLIIKTTGLNTIGELSNRDMLITAGAGMRLNDLRQYTDKYSCRLDEYEGTIGGCLAGERSIVQDQICARVLGLTYVTPEGEIIKLGSRSVKDVAGYRIFSLLCGSRGRLGLISDVIINLANISREYNLVPPLKTSNSGAGKSVRAKLKQDIVKVIDPQGILQ